MEVVGLDEDQGVLKDDALLNPPPEAEQPIEAVGEDVPTANNTADVVPFPARAALPAVERTQPIVHSPTLFGDIRERDVTFCVDTSGSMYASLPAVKEHLIEALMIRAHDSPHESTFNLIEFSSEVTQWSNKMVRCTPQTAAVASQWIKKLEPKTGTNTLDALLTAFSDSSCQAVYLVTDGLPDQHPADVLDHVGYAGRDRPVHCYYIQDGVADSRATEFLQELAMQSYGSFHIVAVAQHGSIERVTPVYRAEATAERIIRTTQGALYPSNHKVCTMSTTMTSPPEIAVEHPLVVTTPYLQPPLYPYYLYPWPLRYYYRNLPHTTGWSRFRSAKGWAKHAEAYVAGASSLDFAPGPGAMLIGLEVLARRNEDGFFYLGSVKSQILANKFLVEFGPCKHGRFSETSYQETFVYDIVSYDDALRHAVVCGDKVLAPWEPEGEKYGPGVVIQGQERRQAEGGGADEEVVVSFFNGKTATVPHDTAVWIPQTLHERITFEMRLPRQVRQDFGDQDHYPEDNLPGYPTSGPVANPAEYERVEPPWLERSDQLIMDRGVYRAPYYLPTYPIYYKYQPRRSAVRSEDIDKMIPGTDLTKSELNEKVMSQLMEHKMKLEGSQGQKLLKRRGILRDNSLQKSVSFQLDSDVEGECDGGDLDTRDSGRGSQEDDLSEDDLFLSDFEAEEKDRAEAQEGMIASDMEKGRQSQMRSRRRRVRRSQRRPPWKYWGNEEAPSVLESNHYGPYRLGPYEASFMPPNLELRKSKLNQEGVEWPTSLTEYVDSFARQKGDGTVYQTMHMPRPPNDRPDKQEPGQDISDVLGRPLSEQERRKEIRQENRRINALQREQNQILNVQEKERMKLLMEDQHRARTAQRLSQEQQRQAEEVQKVERQREAKREINAQIRSRVDESQLREQQREETRLEAMRRNKQHRADLAEQHNQQLEKIKARAQAQREAKAKIQVETANAKQAEQDAQQVYRDVNARRAQIQRIQHFRNLEAEGQKQKVLHGQVGDQQRALYRSYILP